MFTRIVTSFWWCLVNAIICLYVLATNLASGDTVWVWIMAAAIVYWVWAGNRAIKRGKGKRDLNKEQVTQGEIDLLKDCHREMGHIIARKELELLRKENKDGTGHTSESEDHKAGE